MYVTACNIVFLGRLPSGGLKPALANGHDQNNAGYTAMHSNMEAPTATAGLDSNTPEDEGNAQGKNVHTKAPHLGASNASVQPDVRWDVSSADYTESGA
jgi:hypothetical protein